MRVSILHRNRPIECLATIAAIRAAGMPMDITVVDNHSRPELLAQLVQGLPRDLELLVLKANVGWGAAHNVVLRRWLETERSAFCLVSAHDALPRADCVAQLLLALRTHPDWGMACPQYGVPERPRYSVVRGARLERVSPRPAGACEVVDYCHGTLALFRRGCLQDIGVYDERFFAYGDETEIGLRASRRGWKAGLVWGAIVTNPGSWSGAPVIGYLWTRSSLRLARIHGGAPGSCLRLAYVAAVTLILWLRGASRQSQSSPAARCLAMRDYLAGHTGPPPPRLQTP